MQSDKYIESLVPNKITIFICCREEHPHLEQLRQLLNSEILPMSLGEDLWYYKIIIYFYYNYYYCCYDDDDDDDDDEDDE